MDGSVESNDMPALIELSVLHSKDVDAHMEAGFWRRQGLKLYHQLRSNTRDGSARNIAYHYDLGNEFYAAWLDGTMTIHRPSMKRTAMICRPRRQTNIAGLPNLPISSRGIMSPKSVAVGAGFPNTP